MAWCEEGLEETRLLIAPDPGPSGDGVGQLLSLQHPKSGEKACYVLLKNGVVQELHWFKQPYTSWFLGDFVCQDGRLYIATPVDPVFLLLPLFEEARMKKEDDPGKFRQLDEIIFVNGYPGYQHLMSLAETCMQVVCEIKEIGSSKFFRLDDSKVLAWLCYKVQQLKQALLLLDQNYASQDEKNTLADVVTIMGEYLKDEPWLNLLCNKLKLNFMEVTGKVSDAEICPASVENNFVTSNHLQESDRSNNKKKRTGRQAKRAKPETESRNIKEMFFKASRRS